MLKEILRCANCTNACLDVDLDISGLSAHQTKTLEMNVQVRLLTLESQLETERTKLAQLRRQHYKDGADGVEQ